MSWRRLVLFPLGVIPQSAPVYAKPLFTELETRQHVREYADCVVSRHSAQVKTVFALDWRNRDILRHGSSLISDDCAGTIAGVMGIQMKFAMDTYRYALADALVRREFMNLSPNAVGLAVVADEFPTPPDTAKLPANKRRADETRRAYAAKFLEVYGECIVKRAPAESLALLSTMDGKPEGNCSFRDASPHFGGMPPCE